MNREELEAMAKRIRRSIVQMTYQSGLKGAHLGGSMSVAEILAVLYGSILRYDVKNPLSPERDRLILSKAHAAVPAAAWARGFPWGWAPRWRCGRRASGPGFT